MPEQTSREQYSGAELVAFDAGLAAGAAGQADRFKAVLTNAAAAGREAYAVTLLTTLVDVAAEQIVEVLAMASRAPPSLSLSERAAAATATLPTNFTPAHQGPSTDFERGQAIGKRHER